MHFLKTAYFIGILYKIIRKTPHISRTHSSGTGDAMNFSETLHLQGAYERNGDIHYHVISFKALFTVWHECGYGNYENFN